MKDEEEAAARAIATGLRAAGLPADAADISMLIAPYTISRRALAALKRGLDPYTEPATTFRASISGRATVDDASGR